MIGKLSGVVIAAVSAALPAQAAWSQGWKPRRNVELIVPAGAGGSHHITVGLPLQSGGVDVTKILSRAF
ncbi:MAG: hypothetical protein K2Y16_02690 [Burkholderiales bacterium]|nr:hypothetical protein [Burkholderiales bacterium]